METIEIRLNKKVLIPALAVAAVALIGTTYYVCFSGRVEIGAVPRVAQIFAGSLAMYYLFGPIKKLLKNEPVLIISKLQIEIFEIGKPVAFSWSQIIDWKIEHDDGTPYLIIKTIDTEKKINIGWLDKTSSEIDQLFLSYQQSKKQLRS
jgi:hypothetical protein